VNETIEYGHIPGPQASHITEGFPDQKSSLPDSLKKFWTVKDHLSIDDDVIADSMPSGNNVDEAH
jgi:hypothetical protein